MVSALFEQYAAAHILTVGILTAGLQFHQCEWGWIDCISNVYIFLCFSWVSFFLPPAYCIRVLREEKKKKKRKPMMPLRFLPTQPSIPLFSLSLSLPLPLPLSLSRRQCVLHERLGYPT